jgi:putative endonuclease
MPKLFFVYMMTNFRHGSIYTGVTSNLPVRVWQHRNHAFKGSFTDRSDLTVLVWYEAHEGATAAIKREKQLKDWNRGWKVELIEAANPRWNDLWDEIVQ